MKTISPRVYEKLDPTQRVVACIEARARGDDAEDRRLWESCPKLTYVQIDRRFEDTMHDLLGLAMGIEADLKECVLGFFIVIRIDPEKAAGFLQTYSNMREAWQRALAKMGIDGEKMALAGPPPSPVFELIEDLIPKPDMKKSEALCAEMLDFLESGAR